MKMFAILGAVLAVLTLGVAAAMAAPIDLSAFLHATMLSDVALAMSFMPMAGREAHALSNPNFQPPLVAARPRGLVIGARADVTDAAKILAELQKTFENFKTERDKELADINKKLGDVVQTEKVDRINAEITSLQTAIDQVNQALAAAKLGAGGTGETPEERAYATAFDRFFRRGVEDEVRELAVKNAASIDYDPSGGYTVTPQIETTIDRVLSTVSAMRSIARVMSISSSVYRKLVGLGGATGGWVGEREARPETNSPTLSALEFPAMELYANPAATQNLLDDSSVDIAQWLADEVAITFAEMEGAAFISGNGVNRPRGILSYDTALDSGAGVTWGKLGYVITGEAADLIAEDPGDPFINLMMSVKQGYRQNARWLMNRAVQGKVRKFKADDDNYMWQPGLQAGQPATLLGYPITDDDNMSNVGAGAFPVAFGDFQRGYLIVDRIGIRVLRDPFTNKPYVMFYTTKRVGGGVQNFEAIKLMKCST